METLFYFLTASLSPDPSTISDNMSSSPATQSFLFIIFSYKHLSIMRTKYFMYMHILEIFMEGQRGAFSLSCVS